MKPFYPDSCEHDEEDFLGTVLENGHPFDVYIYREVDGSVHTCCRYGSAAHEYRSAGGCSDTRHAVWSDVPSHWLIAIGWEPYALLFIAATLAWMIRD